GGRGGGTCRDTLLRDKPREDALLRVSSGGLSDWQWHGGKCLQAIDRGTVERGRNVLGKEGITGCAHAESRITECAVGTELVQDPSSQKSRLNYDTHPVRQGLFKVERAAESG